MKFLKTGIVVFVVASFFTVQSVFASPAKGTSAYAAAVLKNHPPAGWISHYLGADRYKIAGGIWKVVSTQTDKYFHRPDCPKMMRQSPNYVIGFPSVAAALEAGYLPDPQCHPVSSSITVNIGGAVATHAQKIRLSDGRSTVTLPAGWRKVNSQTIRSKNITANIDSFAPGKSLESGAAIITFDIPRGDSTPLTAATAKQYMGMYNHSGYVNSAIPSSKNNVDVSDITYKGMQGVKMTPKSTKNGKMFLYLVKKGSRMYMVMAGGKKSIPQGAKTIINSYQPR